MKKVEQATLVELNHIDFNQKSGKLRLVYSIDNKYRTVNAVYHNLPILDEKLLKFCINFLALACLVDISTACMAKEVRVNQFSLGNLGKKIFRLACEALRAEIVAEYLEPLYYINLDIKSFGQAVRVPCSQSPLENRVLLLMGGGKDSLYTYHVLKSAGYDIQLFYLTEARRTWQQLRKIYQAFKGHVLQHRVYLNINRRKKNIVGYDDYYFSQFQIGQLIAASLPYAISNRCKYLALGLEKSCDIPTLYYKGKSINHQHQKSSDYVSHINKYLSWSLFNQIEIISPLHGLYDFGIYARFLKEAPHLVPYQSSCGGANSTSRNCGKCEKCAFLAALFVGLNNDRELYNSLFTENPLNNVDLYDIWLARGKDRPSVCAGLKDELLLALSLAKRRGWDLGIYYYYDEKKFVKIDTKKLKRYLKSYHNKLVPPVMWNQIRPLLEIKTDEFLNSVGLLDCSND